MELQLELELEWELKWKLEWEMELQPHKPRELQLDPPQNQGSGPKRRFEALEAIPVITFGGFWGHFSKPEKCAFAPFDQLYNSRFSLIDSHQKLIFKET